MKLKIKIEFKKKDKKKKEIKLICTDLDGTLLDDKESVNEYTKNVLELAKEKGYKVIITTGRPKKFTLLLFSGLDIAPYIICLDGAVIYDVKNNKNIIENTLDKKEVLNLIKTFEEKNIDYHIYTKEKDEEVIITNHLGYNLKRFYNENFLKPDIRKTNIKIVDSVLEYIEKKDLKVFYKINIYTNDKTKLEKVVKEINKKKMYNCLEVNKRNNEVPEYVKDNKNIKEEVYYFTGITNKETSKFSAIKKLQKYLKLEEYGVMAIGDYTNDLDMIKQSDIGVAMGNAEDIVKENANIVTDTNLENGVAKIIQRLINNEI